MEIGTLIVHAFALDSDGELKSTESAKMGVFNPDTNQLVIPTSLTATGEVVINKTGANLVVSGKVNKSSGIAGIAFVPALNGSSGDSYLVTSDTTGLVVGAELKNGATSYGVIIALTDTRIYLSSNLSANVTAVTSAKQYYTIIDVNTSDNSVWMIADEGNIAPLDNITVSDGIFLGEFTGFSTEINATPIDYKGLNKYAKEQAYSEITCNLTLTDLAVNKELLGYINGYTVTDDEDDSSVSIMDNPFAQTVPKDVRLVGIRQMTSDATKKEIHLFHRVKGSSFSLANSKDKFSVESKTLMGMTKNSGDASVYSIFID